MTTTQSHHYQHPSYNSEFEAFPPRSGRSSRRSSNAVRWLTNLFTTTSSNNPSNEKNLLPSTRSKSKSSSRSNSPARSSTDLESQASTLLDMDREKKKPTGKIDARVVSDAIIGLSDGLTVPFALTAGLSALGNTRVVIFAGLAELTAGAISMGLGGYLAAKSEEESYKATLNETKSMIYRSSTDTIGSIRDIFEPYDLPPSLTEDLTYHLSKSPNLTQFLMHFQHNSPEQQASRAITCALTIASGYFLGGFLPLIPYFFVEHVDVALYWSFAFMALSLFGFGYAKSCFYSGWSGSSNIWAGSKGGLQMMLIGGTAAVCAMSFVRVFDSFGASPES